LRSRSMSLLRWAMRVLVAISSVIVTMKSRFIFMFVRFSACKVTNKRAKKQKIFGFSKKEYLDR